MKAPFFIVTMLAAVPLITPADGDIIAYVEKKNIEVSSENFKVTHYHDWEIGSDKVAHWFTAGFDIAKELLSARNDFSYITIIDRRNQDQAKRIPSPPLSRLWIDRDEKRIVGLSTVKLDNPVQLVVYSTDGTLNHSEHIASQVARLNGGEFASFIEKHPQFKEALKQLSLPYFGKEPDIFRTHYIDIFDNPDPIIPEGLYDALVSFRVPHPYSPNFQGSVTNFVDWYFEPDDDSPDEAPRLSPIIRLYSDESFMYLALRDPEALPFIVSWPKQP
jgi:hypothetical protein